MLLVWTAMLYNDDPTVLVRTVPELRLVIATEHSNLNYRILKVRARVQTHLIWHARMDSQQLATRLRSVPSLNGETF